MTVLNVKDFGAKGDGLSNDSAAIRAAIAAARFGDTVVAPPGKYVVLDERVKTEDGEKGVYVRLKSNMTLQLEQDASIIAHGNNLANYEIISADGCENVKITGLGTVQGDRDYHSGTTGEWGFGVALRAHNAMVSGITIKDCWGDGLYIDDSTNVTVSGVISRHNRRQGMSVASVHMLRVCDSVFRDTGGTAPGCGIDLECDRPNQMIEDVLIERNLFMNNKGSNIAIGSPNGTYRNITVRGDNEYDRKTQPIWITGNAGKLGAPAWAFLLNRTLGWLSTYRYWGYPTSWTSK